MLTTNRKTICAIMIGALMSVIVVKLLSELALADEAPARAVSTVAASRNASD